MPEKNHNLPITGIASFAKYPICTDLDALDDADVCVMGIPYPKSRRKTPRNPVRSRSFKLKVRETHGLFIDSNSAPII